MSSSKNVLRTPGPLGDFLGRLGTLHQVAEQSPFAMWSKEEAERRFTEASQQGQVAGYQAGYEAGRAAGHEDGRQEGRAEMLAATEAGYQQAVQEFNAQLAQLLATTEERMAEWKLQTEDRLAQVAVDIARRALARELELHPDAVLDMARQALSEVQEATRYRIRVSPAALGFMAEQREALQRGLMAHQSLEIVSDPDVAQGCIVESDAGVVDARVETYLQRIEDQLEDAA